MALRIEVILAYLKAVDNFPVRREQLNSSVIELAKQSFAAFSNHGWMSSEPLDLPASRLASKC